MATFQIKLQTSIDVSNALNEELQRRELQGKNIPSLMSSPEILAASQAVFPMLDPAVLECYDQIVKLIWGDARSNWASAGKGYLYAWYECIRRTARDMAVDEPVLCHNGAEKILKAIPGDINALKNKFDNGDYYHGYVRSRWYIDLLNRQYTQVFGVTNEVTLLLEFIAWPIMILTEILFEKLSPNDPLLIVTGMVRWG